MILHIFCIHFCVTTCSVFFSRKCKKVRQEVGGGSQVCFVKTETYLEAAILDSDSGGGEGVSCFYTNCSGRLKLDTSQFFSNITHTIQTTKILQIYGTGPLGYQGGYIFFRKTPTLYNACNVCMQNYVVQQNYAHPYMHPHTGKVRSNTNK